MFREALTFLVLRLNQGSSGAAKAESSAGTVTKLLGVHGGQIQLPCAGCVMASHPWGQATVKDGVTRTSASSGCLWGKKALPP